MRVVLLAEEFICVECDFLLEARESEGSALKCPRCGSTSVELALIPFALSERGSRWASNNTGL